MSATGQEWLGMHRERLDELYREAEQGVYRHVLDFALEMGQ